MRRPANSKTGTDECGLCALCEGVVVVCGEEEELNEIAGVLLAVTFGVVLGVKAGGGLCSLNGCIANKGTSENSCLAVWPGISGLYVTVGEFDDPSAGSGRFIYQSFRNSPETKFKRICIFPEQVCCANIADKLA